MISWSQLQNRNSRADRARRRHGAARRPAHQLAQTVGGWQTIGKSGSVGWPRSSRSIWPRADSTHQALQERSVYELDWPVLELEAIWQGLVMNREQEVVRDIAEHSRMSITPQSQVALAALVAEQERAMNPEPDPRERDAVDDYDNGHGSPARISVFTSAGGLACKGKYFLFWMPQYIIESTEMGFDWSTW